MVALTLPPAMAVVLSSPETAPVMATTGAVALGVYSRAAALDAVEIVPVTSVSIAVMLME